MTCSKCNEEMPCVYKSSTLCRRCYAKAQYIKHREKRIIATKLYYKNNEKIQKERQRRWHLRKKYNLTEEQFEELVIYNNGRCCICHDLPDKILNVDHCHRTGIVRGLLCQDCNVALGLLKDDIQKLKSAIEYLDTKKPR
jgi:hypothetical protein